MIVDTSAWIEYLRATGSTTNLKVRDGIESGASLRTTDPVVMELLAGAPTETAALDLKRFLYRFQNVPVESLADFEDAALIQRTCRRAGGTVRSAVDCLIAAVAIREGLPVLASDRDFEVIARHVGLELVSV